MRILTVCASTNVFGAEVITLKMLDGFKRSGHEQLAVTSTWTDGEFNRRLALLGVSEIRMPFGALSKRLRLQPMWWTANVLVRLPLLWTRWRRAIRQFRPDIIIFTSSRQPLVVYPCAWRAPSFSIEYTYLAPTSTRRLLYGLLARKITGFVAVSRFMHEHIAKVGVPREKIHVVRSAAFSRSDRPRVEEESAQFIRSDSKTLRIGIIGQIAFHKGHDCLIEAVKLLVRRRRFVSVYIFGTGPSNYISHLEEKLVAAELSNNFHWMGYEDKRSSIYGNIDVCVVPSLFGDPLPTVAMEAGAYGVPVIASRVGGLPEIVEHGVTGWLVDSESPEELARRIEWLIEHPEKARAMGAAGRERIFSLFTVDRMVGEFENLFSEFAPFRCAQRPSIANAEGQ